MCDVETVPKERQIDFCLRCEDDRLENAGIRPGDIVYFRAGDVQDGAIAAVSLDGEHHVGQLLRTGDELLVVPLSPKYSPMIFVGPERERARVVGEVVGWVHWTSNDEPGNQPKGQDANT